MTQHTLAQRVHWIGLFVGPGLALLVYFLLPAGYTNAAGETVTFSHAGRASMAVGVWMAVWWLTEAVHISVTALIPVAVLPLVGALPVEEAAARYAHPLIFLFMGGFLISLSMQRWGLHRRIALATVRAIGTQPKRIVGGFMLAAAALSMWVSNTATALMMLPIAGSVLDRLVGADRSHEGAGGASGGDVARLGVCLMLGVAYGASIGGIGTIIGSPPNGVVVGYIADNLDEEIGFAQWLMIGLPVVVVFLPLAWWLLTRVLYPVHGDVLGEVDAGEALEGPGPMNRGEKATLAVFLLAVVCWIFRPVLTELRIGSAAPLSGLSDAGIAMLAALLLFVIPVQRSPRRPVLDWQTATKLPWGILILFGGGLSLARALDANGASGFLGSQVEALAGAPVLLLVAAVVVLVIFLTELTSNTATTATLVPILAALGPALGVDPYLLMFPAAIAASCAFMMPVATPPNAIVFSSGHVTMRQMIRAGLLLNVVGVVLVTLLLYWLLGAVLGVDLIAAP